MTRRELLIGLCCLIFLSFAPAYGQCTSAGFAAQWHSGSKQVELTFGVPVVVPADGDNGVRITIFDATAQTVIDTIDRSRAHYIDLSGKDASAGSEVSQMIFKLSSAIDPKNNKYIASVVGLKYHSCEDSSSANVFAKLGLAKHDTSSPGPTTLSATKGRDDSDLYLSGQLSGATGAKPAYTADIKVQVRIPLNNPNYGKDNKFRPGFWLVPSFDLKASTNPKLDGNSVLIGVAVPFGFPTTTNSARKKLVTWIQPEPAFFIESDKQFRMINPIFRGRGYFLFRTFGSRNLQFFPQAFIGLETGGNSKTPIVGSYAGKIIRPNAGIHAYLNLFYSEKPGRKAFIEADYIRRWPLNGEPRFSEDSSGKLNLISVGKSPRNYFWTKLEYDFNDYFGVTAGLDYGVLPPVYTKVRNKFTFGLVLKSGLVFKPK